MITTDLVYWFHVRRSKISEDGNSRLQELYPLIKNSSITKFSTNYPTTVDNPRFEGIHNSFNGETLNLYRNSYVIGRDEDLIEKIKDLLERTEVLYDIEISDTRFSQVEMPDEIKLIELPRTVSILGKMKDS